LLCSGLASCLPKKSLQFVVDVFSFQLFKVANSFYLLRFFFVSLLLQFLVLKVKWRSATLTLLTWFRLA
jgi:hypothetical protein